MISQLEDITTSENKKVYFASDFHLGAPSNETSLLREKKVVRWLKEVKGDAQHIFILGDIFDFWFEYKYTIPKGFTRLLGTLMEIRDDGIPLLFLPETMTCGCSAIFRTNLKFRFIEIPQG
jgi:UDP-2,3-diacylglucosamine hydrolase